MLPYNIDELRSIIAPIARRYGVQRVILFGSYARGEATAQSDVDLLIFGGSGFRATQIFALSEDLRAALNTKVDVYEIRELDPLSAFHNTVMQEGLEIA
ncbi:MAG: nucleotidyltransferase domain-containing protein [Oscillospiraceae bacterium]|nr:nucleotidyltransferase domain-containing protein [Oscillospiraceae bacterium]MCD8191672.1 nucleotidyltransferase domain-containing protein [Oscillospiraceae bacterium]